MPKSKHPDININHLCWFIFIVVVLVVTSQVLTVYEITLNDIALQTQQITAASLPRKQNNGLAWVEFDFGNSRRRKFEVEVDGYQYPFVDILKGIEKEGRFRIEVVGEKEIKVDEMRQYQGGWILSKNEQSVNEPLGALILSQGDWYKFRYLGSEPR